MTSDLPILKRTRGYLPHWECGGGPYFVTFRLQSSIPASIVRALQAERDEAIDALRCRQTPVTPEEWDELESLFADRLDARLDVGVGECLLRFPGVAEGVIRALRHFDGERYCLHAWCVMPNHVHVVFSIRAAWGAGLMGGASSSNASPLSVVLQSWKSFTSKEANALLGRSGTFWQKEYYDRVIRTERELIRCVEYTARNPVKAGLCGDWQAWPWAGLGLVDLGAVAALREEWKPSSLAFPAFQVRR
jgi:REP element-mobilizing transposase RayT